jgi:hypothetical protein
MRGFWKATKLLQHKTWHSKIDSMKNRNILFPANDLLHQDFLWLFQSALIFLCF